MLTSTPRTVATTVAIVALLASGCSSAAEPEADRETDFQGGEVLQPGRPGEPNKTLGADATVESAQPNDADVAFMQMMVPHHAQALVMSELAQTRASDEQVVAIARRIKGAQGPEITAMTAWLRSRDLDVPESMDDLDMSGHGHSGHDEGDMEDMEDMGASMMGMLTDRQMTRLARARGAEFDRLFIAGMIQHHEGAVSMARDEMAEGSETLALELAADVAAGQQAEIRRMVDIRGAL